MTTDRNIEARRLIADQLAAIDTEREHQASRRRSLMTQTQRNAAELHRLDEERTGLAQALEALGGPPPETEADPEDDTDG